jgi:hypothetical protein
VIRNAAFMDDGTPMPTLFWLVGRRANEAVAGLEAAGGVKEAERTIEPAAIESAHNRYAHLRRRSIPEGHIGPTPYGGVGGTRKGVKCLHAHFAFYLAGGDDPVGEWVADRLAIDISGYSRTHDHDEEMDP